MEQLCIAVLTLTLTKVTEYFSHHWYFFIQEPTGSVLDDDESLGSEASSGPMPEAVAVGQSVANMSSLESDVSNEDKEVCYQSSFFIYSENFRLQIIKQLTIIDSIECIEWDFHNVFACSSLFL